MVALQVMQHSADCTSLHASHGSFCAVKIGSGQDITLLLMMPMSFCTSPVSVIGAAAKKAGHVSQALLECYTYASADDQGWGRSEEPEAALTILEIHF